MSIFWCIYIAKRCRIVHKFNGKAKFKCFYKGTSVTSRAFFMKMALARRLKILVQANSEVSCSKTVSAKISFWFTGEGQEKERSHMWSLCHMWVFWQIYEMNPSFQRWALWDNQGPFRALQLRGNSPGVVFTLSKPSRLNTFCEFEEFQLYLQIPSIRPLLEIAIRNCHQKWSSEIVIKNCHQKLSSKIFIKGHVSPSYWAVLDS